MPQVAQVLTVLLLSPLRQGAILQVEERVQRGQGPGMFPPYRDLWKLFRKRAVVPETASWLFAVTPVVALTCMMTVPIVIPVLTDHPLPLFDMGDILGGGLILTLGSFMVLLAGLDSGSAYCGIGSSRAVMLSILAEPTLILVFVGITLLAKTMIPFTVNHLLVSAAAAHSSVRNHFNPERRLYSRDVFKRKRNTAFAEWRQLCPAWVSAFGGKLRPVRIGLTAPPAARLAPDWPLPPHGPEPSADAWHALSIQPGRHLMTTRPPSLATGYGAAWSIVFVWSFWLIVSRIASRSGLTVFDLAAMRYGLAALIAVPLSLYYKPWRGLRLAQIAVVSFILGPVYILCVFSGFRYAPAAHGGIFMNGVLPLISILFGIVLFRTAPGFRQVIGAALILVSTIVLAWDGTATRHPDAWIGDLLFVVGALFFASYVILSERWSLGAMQVIFCGTVVNAILYVPIWALWLPSGLRDAPWQPLLLQAIYQGFVPNLVGLIFIAYASRTIGNANTSSILAAVPGVGGVLGAVILGETLTLPGTLAIPLLTAGLLISVRRRTPVVADTSGSSGL